MRKITEHAINAFENGGKCSEGNMSVHDGLMYLHGNLIAKYNDQGKLEISNCGWFSPTTKERLNALKGVSIEQKDFKWFLNGKLWNGEMIEV